MAGEFVLEEVAVIAGVSLLSSTSYPTRSYLSDYVINIRTFTCFIRFPPVGNG